MSEKEALSLLQIFGKIGSFISFLPLIMSLFRWKYFKEKPLIWLFLYFLLGVILNAFTSAFVDLATKYWTVVGSTLQRWKIDDTFFVDPIYFLRSAIFLGLFCSQTLKNEKYANFIKWTSIVFAIFIIINTCFIEGYEEYQTIGNSLDNLFKILLSGIMLRSIFVIGNQRSLIKIPHFWFAISILIIGSCAGLIDFLSSRILEQSSVIFYQAHIVKDCFVILAFICFSIGTFYVPWKKQI